MTGLCRDGLGTGVVSMNKRALRRVGLAAVAAGAILAGDRADAAGGAFAVDDAEVGSPGECKVESWASFASNRDQSSAVAPACVTQLGVPVELGGQFQHSRDDGAWSSGGTLRAKTNLIPVAGHPFGLTLSGGSTWDFASGANTGSFINVPLTLPIRDGFRINLNGGWQYDATVKIHYATWGAGFEWNFVKPMTLIGEIYGQSGRLSVADEEEAPPPNSILEPRSQIGLRVTPKDNIDLDLIWGRNITGENAHWLTLGLNLRF